MKLQAVPSVRNNQAEALLTELGLTWSMELVRNEQLDRQASRSNQARLLPIDEALVERYMRSKRSGAEFPAIIVGSNGRNVLTIADGNHRDEAYARCGEETQWAYVFKYASEEEFRTVSFIANSRLNGASNTLEERLMHASHFVQNGAELQEAATQFGVSKQQLSTYRNAQKGRHRFAAIGIGARSYATFSDHAIASLNASVADDAVRSAIKLINDGHSLQDVVGAARDASRGILSEREKASAQVAAFTRLEEAKQKHTAKALITGTVKRDTLRLRLLGAVNTLEEVSSRGLVDKYKDILCEMDAMLVSMSIKSDG